MRISLAALAVATAASLITLPAATAAPASVAPGAPHRMMPANPPATITNMFGDELKVPPYAWVATCSQGPNGTIRTLDGTTQRVLLTASHCVNPLPGMPEIKPEVMVPQGANYNRIGTRINSNHVPPAALTLADPVGAIKTADWGIVLIDAHATATNLSQSRNVTGGNQGEPVKLTTIRDYRTLAPGEVSLDNLGQPICKDGATTGRTCGTQIGRTRDGVYSWNLGYRQGDSGGVNYDPRDGAILGVSSMVLGPLGKAQPADRIIEDAYGIPDGAVNDHFTVTPDSAPRAEFDTTGEEVARIDTAVQQLNPDYKAPNARAELDNAIAAAQADAGRALTGQLNPAEIQQAAQHHSYEITRWADLALAQRISGN